MHPHRLYQLHRRGALGQRPPLRHPPVALSSRAIRILKLFGKDVDYISTTVGQEQVLPLQIKKGLRRPVRT